MSSKERPPQLTPVTVTVVAAFEEKTMASIMQRFTIYIPRANRPKNFPNNLNVLNIAQVGFSFGFFNEKP